jgi:hypothetical protein
MQRKNAQSDERKAENTDALIRDGPLRSSGEAAVMAVERREWAVQSKLGQPAMGGTLMLGRKAPAFHGLHEPDDARVSCPESVSGSGCNSPGRLGTGSTLKKCRERVVTRRAGLAASLGNSLELTGAVSIGCKPATG